MEGNYDLRFHTAFMKKLARGLLKKTPNIIPQAHHDNGNRQIPNCRITGRKKCYHNSHGYQVGYRGHTDLVCSFCSKPVCKVHHTPVCNRCYTTLRDHITVHPIQFQL